MHHGNLLSPICPEHLSNVQMNCHRDMTEKYILITCNSHSKICTEKSENDELISEGIFKAFARVLRGSVVRCVTHNLQVPGSSRTGSSGFSRECLWARRF